MKRSSVIYFWCVLIICVSGALGRSVEDFNDEDEDYDGNLHQNETAGNREGKLLFPFFSVVRFANTECASANTVNGTCFTRRECNNLSGTSTGTCASRRGVCCVVQRTCGGVTNVNNTYFVNSGYPSSYAGGGACTITINRCNTNICQLRLDFMELTLAQPDGDGNCVTDRLTVTGGNTVVPILCGDNTGQTIFVDFDGDNSITLSISTNGSTTLARRWNIKIVQLGCDCPGLAPLSCLQYYTGTSGTISSFNYGSAANQALSTSLVTGTRQLVNENYGICIRMEAGYCSITYAQTSDIYSFTLTGDVEGADTTVLGTTLGALNDGSCTTDFIVIPNPFFVSTGLAVGSDRFCGLGFQSVTTAAKPFVVYVVTDGSEAATATTSPDVANRGFTLTYTQGAC